LIKHANQGRASQAPHLIKSLAILGFLNLGWGRKHRSNLIGKKEKGSALPASIRVCARRRHAACLKLSDLFP
jgi:hypothetical protein